MYEASFEAITTQQLYLGVDKVQAGAIDLQRAVTVQDSFGECPAKSRLPLQTPSLLIYWSVSVDYRDRKYRGQVK